MEINEVTEKMEELQRKRTGCRKCSEKEILCEDCGHQTIVDREDLLEETTNCAKCGS